MSDKLFVGCARCVNTITVNYATAWVELYDAGWVCRPWLAEQDGGWLCPHCKGAARA